MNALCLLLVLSCGITAGTTKTSSDSLNLPLRDSFSYPKLWVPFGLLTNGIQANGNGRESVKNEIAEERNEHLSNFRSHIDDYLQYTPIAAAYALDWSGIKSKTDIANRTAILIKGELLMSGTVTVLKNVTHQLRPDGSSYNSFPSGHTAQAFAAATFLNEEYKARLPWMPYASYSVASSVGALRIANNRHYISDVLAGAAIGILSMKVAYWTHRYHWGHRNRKVRRS